MIDEGRLGSEDEDPAAHPRRFLNTSWSLSLLWALHPDQTNAPRTQPRQIKMWGMAKTLKSTRISKVNLGFWQSADSPQRSQTGARSSSSNLGEVQIFQIWQALWLRGDPVWQSWETSAPKTGVRKLVALSFIFKSFDTNLY